MLASNWSSLSERRGPVPPYTSETTPTSEQLATLSLAKTSEKRDVGRESELLEPEGGGFSSRSGRERVESVQCMVEGE